jgi:SanA protein
MKKFWKITLWTTVSVIIIIAGAAAFAAYCCYSVTECKRYCENDINKITGPETALLLGTAKITPNGVPNLYFQERIKTAAELYHAGKIKHLLISGDNSRKDYDEPTDMKNALLEQGVPESAITLDYAGFRTLDSVVRAKNVFGKNAFLIITQPGHAERAVYIAREHGIDATACYAAEPLQYKWLIARNRKREKLAAIAAWLDVNILHRAPKFPR